VTEQKAGIVLEHENALMALFEGSGLDEYLAGILGWNPRRRKKIC
jgi:hypothetical protein